MSSRTRNSLTCSAVLWVVVLLAFGGARRWIDSVLTAAPAGPIALDKPLSTLPLRLGSWVGNDVPVDPAVMRVSGADDYVNRAYRDERSGMAVNLYVGYTARPVTMLGHRPDICYPANGWLRVSKETGSIGLPRGGELECEIHEFKRDDPHAPSLVVLSYYVLQGRPTTEWTDFWGPRWRQPNFSRDPSYYVAQVQVTATVLLSSMTDRARAAVRRFAADAQAEIHALLPMTSEYSSVSGGAPTAPSTQ